MSALRLALSLWFGAFGCWTGFLLGSLGWERLCRYWDERQWARDEARLEVVIEEERERRDRDELLHEPHELLYVPAEWCQR